MKQSDLIVLGVAAVAVLMILRSGGAAASTGSGPTAKKPAERVSEIFDSLGRPWDNGWRYYDDGVAIDPDGNYYKGGQLVYSAPKG